MSNKEGQGPNLDKLKVKRVKAIQKKLQGELGAYDQAFTHLKEAKTFEDGLRITKSIEAAFHNILQSLRALKSVSPFDYKQQSDIIKHISSWRRRMDEELLRLDENYERDMGED